MKVNLDLTATTQHVGLRPTGNRARLAKQFARHTASGPTRVEISPLAKDLAQASGLLEEAETIRPEMVERGKEILARWDSLDDKQLDNIASSLLEEL